MLWPGNGSFSSFPYGNLSDACWAIFGDRRGRRRPTPKNPESAIRGEAMADMTEVEEVEEVDLERKLAGGFHKLSSAISKHQHKKVLKHANERK